MKIVIWGPPKSGKSTVHGPYFSDLYAIPLYHTDDTILFGWQGASDVVARWLHEKDQFVIEGVAVPRAIRKYIEKYGEAPDLDLIVVAGHGPNVLSDHQERLAKGITTVAREIEPYLEGVPVTYV